MAYLLIIMLVIAVIFLRFLGKNYKLTRDVSLCFVGTMGSGKTLLAVKKAIAHNNAQYERYLVKKVFNFLRPKSKKKALDIPLIYASIPLKHKRYTPLKAEHLLLKLRINENSTILIDEVGDLANTLDYGNRNLKVGFQKFVRFIRHYLGKTRLIVTDQSSDFIVNYVRRRFSYIYHLSNFRKFCFFFYRINVIPILSVEDVNTTVSSKQERGTSDYRIYGLLSPFKRHRRYDTRCYSVLFDNIPVDKDLKYGVPTTLKTNYFIDLVNYKD